MHDSIEAVEGFDMTCFDRYCFVCINKDKGLRAETKEKVNICNFPLAISLPVLTNLDPFRRQIKLYVHVMYISYKCIVH